MSAVVAAGSAMQGSLEGAPELYRTPAVRPSLAEAQAWCKRLAETHYENFHVATFFLPASLRPHFYCIYAFCRTSDDLGDEVGDKALATSLLAEWRAMLHECFADPGRSRHPVFVALQPTIAAKHLPVAPFDDLITAFEQDQVYTHHESLATLEEYSRCSANPVGRLVLLVSGYTDPELMALSDEICTGLQLANFYQDIVSDWIDRDRRYLPADIMQKFGVADEQIAERRFDSKFRAMMEFLVDDARARLTCGQRIATLAERDLAATLSLFAKGGHAILDAIAAQNYDTLRSRPVVTKARKLRLLGGALAGKLSASVLPSRPRATERERMKLDRTPELSAAYALCRAIAKHEAKNFYWAFLALPRHKSDAMCAIYAFMRKADDLSDDESLSLEQRRVAMAEWTASWRRSRAEGTADPLFLAVDDTQKLFGISNELLEQLVAGTAMDLQSKPGGVVAERAPAITASGKSTQEYQAYETFDSLYRYCYLVASVVGLATIRIFGYREQRAELLAEQTGIAFQLTNILRDVREDAQRGRIYLPLEDIAASGSSVEQLALAISTASTSPELMALLAKEIGRAQEYYKAGDALIPLIDNDAQPAMRVLVTIYHRLLDRIAADPQAVFRERVSVSTPAKLAILGRGLAESAWARLT